MPGFPERFKPSKLLSNAVGRHIRPQIEPPIEVQIEVQRRAVEPYITTNEALTKLRDNYDIQTVFYPGSGSDKIDGIFKRVVYFDAELGIFGFGHNPSPESIRGLYSYNDDKKDQTWGLPFKDGAFDALYHKDPDQLSASSHPLISTVSIPLGVNATYEFLRVIKDGGLLIYVLDSCELSPPLEVYKKIPGIEDLQRVNTSHGLSILQKRKHITLAEVRNAFKKSYDKYGGKT